MVEYSDIAPEASYGPIDDEEFWETVYPIDGAPESLTDDSVHQKENDDDVSAVAADMETWTWVPQVLNDGQLNGEGTGAEVTGVVAAVLDAQQKYGFEFTFYKVDDVTPWEDVKADGPQTA